MYLSAEDLQTKGVYMNAVDTGWINDENPLERAAAYAQSAGVYVCIHMYAYIHVYMYAYTCVYVCIHMHTYTHVSRNIQTNIHATYIHRISDADR